MGFGRHDREQQLRLTIESAVQSSAALWAAGRERAGAAAFDAACLSEPDDEAPLEAEGFALSFLPESLATAFSESNRAAARSADGDAAHEARLERLQDWIVGRFEAFARRIDGAETITAEDFGAKNRAQEAFGVALSVFSEPAARLEVGFPEAPALWVKRHPHRAEQFGEMLRESLIINAHVTLTPFVGELLLHAPTDRWSAERQIEDLSEALPALAGRSLGALAGVLDKARELAVEGLFDADDVARLGREALHEAAGGVLRRNADSSIYRSRPLHDDIPAAFLDAASRVAELSPAVFWDAEWWSGADEELGRFFSRVNEGRGHGKSMPDVEQESFKRRRMSEPLARSVPENRWAALRLAAYLGDAEIRVSRGSFSEHEPAWEAWWPRALAALPADFATSHDARMARNEFAWIFNISAPYACEALRAAADAGHADLDLARWRGAEPSGRQGFSLADLIEWSRVAVSESRSAEAGLLGDFVQRCALEAPSCHPVFRGFTPEIAALDTVLSAIEGSRGMDRPGNLGERLLGLAIDASRAIFASRDPRDPISPDFADFDAYCASTANQFRFPSDHPLKDIGGTLRSLAESLRLEREIREARQAQGGLESGQADAPSRERSMRL
jgi:hypothetical protein